MGTIHRGPDDRGHEGGVSGLRPGPGRGGFSAFTCGVHGLPLLRGHHRLWALDILPQLSAGCPGSCTGEVLGGQVAGNVGAVKGHVHRALVPTELPMAAEGGPEPGTGPAVPCPVNLCGPLPLPVLHSP